MEEDGADDEDVVVAIEVIVAVEADDCLFVSTSISDVLFWLTLSSAPCEPPCDPLSIASGFSWSMDWKHREYLY